MTKFTYSGPADTIEIRTGSTRAPGGETAIPTYTDVQLSPGADVDLPEDLALVKGMVAAGHLTPAPRAAKSIGTKKTGAAKAPAIKGEDV